MLIAFKTAFAILNKITLMIHEPRPAAPSPRSTNEISLDPADWDEFARVAHSALDDAIDNMRTVRDRPPWRSLPDAARREIDEPIPQEPTALEDVYEQFRRSIQPYPTGNAHPRFWGWVMGNGTADGMLADLLASAMNPHLAGYDQSASAVEKRVIAWFAELMGYPTGTSGLLVSGGTAANLTGLAVARSVGAGFDVREQGLAGTDRSQLTAYGSVETHSWAEKSCDLLGLGRAAFRRVAADAEGQVDLEALRAAIHRDRDRGERPFCVVGNAGTVDSGAIDDLDALADLCAEEGLWLHVDGAFGALAALAPSLQPQLHGLSRTDSVAFDLHKWGYLQYEVGCVLVQDADAHRAAFATRADYLQPPGRGIQPTLLEFPDLGLQLSRGFRALKVWMALKTHGVRRIGRVIEQNVAQARYLAERIDAEPCLERTSPVPLNVVCFRYVAEGLDESALEELNREILLRVQEQGIAIPSSTRRQGRYSLRLAITNHRSRREDFDLFFEAVLRFGHQILNEPDGATDTD